MNIIDYIKNNILCLDGGMGTILQKSGLKSGELPETWNISHPEIITSIHKDYFVAGSNVVSTNTFGANTLKFSESQLEEIISAAITNARNALEQSGTNQEKWVALDIGPTGRMLKPYGDLEFEQAVQIFASTVRLGVKYGADLILIETMSDSYETKAALLAAKENSSLPVFVSNAYGQDSKLMTGATPCCMVAMLEGMGADAIGVNCSLGPKALTEVVEEYLKYSSVPVILKPNAGLPRAVNSQTVYDVMPSEFADDILSLVKKGVSIVGGCCGTDPEYISEVVKRCNGIKANIPQKKDFTCVCSYSRSAVFGDRPILIGERINPTGKKRFKQALIENDIDYILKEGLSQEEKGVHLLDVNVGLPEIDEADMLKRSVFQLQSVSSLPLQIDTSNLEAMESALRIYNGKAMINSVNGKAESMQTVFPLAKKYGGVVVCLTLDHNGIPSNAEGRLEIAKNILKTATQYGIDKKDLIFDPLALTVSADANAAKETLRAVHLIRTQLGCHTCLGVSNVSFGLPSRDIINSTFFAMALNQGLSAAIMNPYSDEMMKVYFAYRALNGMDLNCADFISFAQTLPQALTSSSPNINSAESSHSFGSELQKAIIKGLKESASAITLELLKTNQALGIVQNEIIPALNQVGVAFENKKVYLPQLLMSAEAAQSAFEQIKSHIKGGKSADKCAFIIATVKGDIHDIGKNIVKLLMENYGFAVTDLGKDVDPEIIVQETVRQHAPIVGLSALMTTTVPYMQETIKLLRLHAPWCKIVVGGAVLTPEYAQAIGADHYAKDAMETVRYSEKINSLL